VVLQSKKQHSLGTDGEKRKQMSRNNGVAAAYGRASGASDFSLSSLDSCPFAKGASCSCSVCAHALPPS